MIELRSADSTPPPLHFTEASYVDSALAKRWVAYIVAVALCFIISVIGVAGVLVMKFRLDRDSAVAMLVKGNKASKTETKTAPTAPVAVPEPIKTAPAATVAIEAKPVGQTFFAKKPFPGEVKPAPTANVPFLLGSKTSAKDESATDAKVVMIATVFDHASAMALKDEVAQAVNNCNDGKAFELCVKPVRGGQSYAALVTSKAGLVAAEAERIASCFKEQQNKDAVIVAASKYRSLDCL